MSLPQRWIEADRRTVWTTRLFSVEQRAYDRPGGKRPVQRDVIVHPGAVVILPLLDDDRIVMIRNYRHAVDQTLWELPAGTVEPDEPPIETARRELAEETGYEAASVRPMSEFFTSPGILTERMYAFVARDLRYRGQDLDETEDIDVEPVDIEDVRRRLTSGQFQDAKTIAVLGLFFLGRG